MTERPPNWARHFGRKRFEMAIDAVRRAGSDGLTLNQWAGRIRTGNKNALMMAKALQEAGFVREVGWRWIACPPSEATIEDAFQAFGRLWDARKSAVESHP